MTILVDFIIEIAKRVFSSIIATYSVRFLDKVKENKNDRHSAKSGH